MKLIKKRVFTIETSRFCWRVIAETELGAMSILLSNDIDARMQQHILKVTEIDGEKIKKPKEIA